MAITPRPFEIASALNFRDALYEFLKLVEGDIPFVYSDERGIPTLGIGYALVVQGTDEWELRDGYQANLSAAGISLTPAQLADLESKLTQAMNALNGTGATNPFSPAATGTNPLGWTIDSTQSRNLFNYVVPEYETRVKNWLGNDTLYSGMQDSMEMVALVSLAYQGFINVGKSPALKRAIVNGDRTEAWYEIRYNTNTEARRFLEADTFSLYNPNPTEADYKSAYRTLTRHRTKILGADGVADGGDDYDQENQSRLNTAISILNSMELPQLSASVIQSVRAFNKVLINEALDDELAYPCSGHSTGDMESTTGCAVFA